MSADIQFKKQYFGEKLFASYLQRLDRSQWLKPGQLLKYQIGFLRPVLLHAYRNVSFYRERFQQAGLDESSFTPANWYKIPLLQRSDLQGREILSPKIPAQHGGLYENSSSGSTGQPVRIYCTELTQFAYKLLTVRDTLWHQRDMKGKHAAIKLYPQKEIPAEGELKNGWGLPIDRVFETGLLALLDIRNTIQHQLNWLLQQNPDYLLTYPSNLKALIEASQSSGVKPPGLKQVITISERLQPELKSLCMETWGVKLVDVYSCQELGYLASQCPECDNYHVHAESVFLEVLNDDGGPCQPGEVGRVVLTSLLNYATPLIRYEIRDYAEVGEPCQCGRGLPVIKRIVGRRRNMITFPSGEQNWPFFNWGRYNEVAHIRQFQFVQHTLHDIEMKLVTDPQLTAEQEAELKVIVQEGLGYPFDLTFTYLNEIPVAVNGKFEEFLSKLDAD